MRVDFRCSINKGVAMIDDDYLSAFKVGSKPYLIAKKIIDLKSGETSGVIISVNPDDKKAKTRAYSIIDYTRRMCFIKCSTSCDVNGDFRITRK